MPPSLIPAPGVYVDEGAGVVRERYLCGGCGKELGSPGAVREHAAELRRVAKSQRPGAPERAALEARAERLELDAREWEERDRKPSDPRQRADLYTWLALEELACSFADATDAKLAARARDHLRAAAAWLAVLTAERADGLSEGARVPVRIGRSVRTGTVEQQRGVALLVRIDFGPGRGAAFEWFDGETGKPIGRERHDVLGLDAARARWRLLVAEDDTAPDTERPPVASEPGACREVVSEEETELGSVRLYLEADTPEALEQAVRSARESLNLGGGR